MLTRREKLTAFLWGMGSIVNLWPRRRDPGLPTLAELNRWMTENYDEIQRKARENTIRLTGKPRL